jgi:organic hydroperoxide reductase OsmC/OhrA
MYTYEVNLKWTVNRKGVLSSPKLPQQIEVATPPDFPKGMEGVWTPEHLFVASINGCLMTTFLAIAENSKLEFISYESNAACNIAIIEGKHTLTEIILKPKITIHHTQKKDRAIHILEMSKRACVISNAIKTTILLEPEIIVEKVLI